VREKKRERGGEGEEEADTVGPTLSQLPRQIKPELKPLRDLLYTGSVS
jgi:hypothetical protein